MPARAQRETIRTSRRRSKRCVRQRSKRCVRVTLIVVCLLGGIVLCTRSRRMIGVPSHFGISQRKLHELRALNTIGIKTMRSDDKCARRLVEQILRLRLPFPILVAVEEDTTDQQHLSRIYTSGMRGDVAFLPIGRDGGLSKGRNAIISHVKTPFVTLLDDDFVFNEKESPRVLLNHICFVLTVLQTRQYDLIGGCTLQPCLRYRLSKQDPHHLNIISHEYVQGGPKVQSADMVDNFFVARATKLRNILWDENLKVGEHEDFFIRARHKVAIGHYADLFMANDRSCRDQDKWRKHLALYHRSRVFGFWKQTWNKNGFLRMSTNFTSYELHCQGAQGFVQFPAFQAGMDKCTIIDTKTVENPWGGMSGEVYDIPALAIPIQSNRGCTVAVVTVAIGKYFQFIPDLVQSSEKYFLKRCERHYFVFTDDDTHGIGLKRNVHLIPQERLGFPLDSIMRFEMYLTLRTKLSEYDYIYAIDSDCLFVSEIGEEVLGEMVATLSAWYFGRPAAVWPFDDNTLSAFYVPSNKRRKYYAGGFYGGRSTRILDFWENIVPLVRESIEHSYLPPWHDESVINFWFNVVNAPAVILGAEYLLPEPPTDSWLLPEQQLYYKVEAYTSKYRPGREPKLLNLGTRKAENPSLRDSEHLSVNSSAIRFEEKVTAFSCSSSVPVAADSSSFSCMHWIPGAFSVQQAHAMCAELNMRICSVEDARLHVMAGTPVCLRGIVHSAVEEAYFLFRGDNGERCDVSFKEISGFEVSESPMPQSGADSLGTVHCCRRVPWSA